RLRCRSQAVRQRSAKPPSPVRFRAAPLEVSRLSRAGWHGDWQDAVPLARKSALSTLAEGALSLRSIRVLLLLRRPIRAGQAGGGRLELGCLAARGYPRPGVCPRGKTHFDSRRG